MNGDGITQLQATPVPQVTIPGSWEARRTEQAAYTGPNRYMAALATGAMTADQLHQQSLTNLAGAQNILNVLAPVVP